MPRIPIIGRDDVVRRLNVKAANLDRYAPVPMRNPATGRMRTVYVRADDTLIVDADFLDEDAREAAGEEPGYARITVTASTDYTTSKPGNSALFIDASFSVVVPADEAEAAQEAIQAALEDTLQSSGLPTAGVKIGFEVEAGGRSPGVKASSVRMGSRRDRLKPYSTADDAARSAIEDALSDLEPRPMGGLSREASRRLTARQGPDGRWRDKAGRFVKPPSTVVVR